MRVLPGSVDVGVPQGDGSEAVLPGVELEVLFTHPLGDAVGADRVGGGGLRGRLGDVPVEHAPRGGEDDPLTATGNRRIENIDQADAVDLGVEPRLADRAADRHLGCLMADGIRLLRSEHFGHRGRVADIDFVKRHASRQVFPRTAGEVIEHGNRMAGCQQGVHDVAADKAGTAGDEGFHEFRANRVGYPQRNFLITKNFAVSRNKFGSIAEDRSLAQMPLGEFRPGLGNGPESPGILEF
jgi:hypothetical protein